jgi:N-dimethylarginine dimethylaminohydrolase
MVLVKHAREAFISQDVVAAQWRALNFTAPPDFSRALAEYDRFLDIIASAGARIVQLPLQHELTLDSIYTRDASIVTPNGVVACSMGKPARGGEPAVQKEQLRQRGWTSAGSIAPPGLLEGGDVVWLDDRTLVIGQGARTNAEGIRQLQILLGESIDV